MLEREELLMKYLLLILFVLSPIAVLAQHGHTNEAPPVLIPGLGEINHPVSTTNPEAQKFFNQGLACLFGFNHEEAVRSFKYAATLDPQLAMAHWGIALALGSNYNMPAEGPQLLEAYSHLQKRGSSDKASGRACLLRYSSNVIRRISESIPNNSQSITEMRWPNSSRKYSDDLDAATLYAERIMDVNPWKLWSLDGKPAPDTEEIISVLESVLRRNPNHPGANHYYIHAVEASPNPERALASAARLGGLAPGAGHLVHMPSHIYIRTGDYDKALQANSAAIVADRQYMVRTGANTLYAMFYYNHNVHFLASSYAMKGRFADALKTATELEAGIQPHLKTMPMLEMFAHYRMITLVRFGRWDAVLKTRKPAADLKTTSAFWHFSRGMAFAGMKSTSQAETELKELQAIEQGIPAGTPFGNNTADILRVAHECWQQNCGKVIRNLAGCSRQFKQKKRWHNEPSTGTCLFGSIWWCLLSNGDNAQAETVFRREPSVIRVMAEHFSVLAGA
jgi:tetratricopeptide (TPR) repeat protein